MKTAELGPFWLRDRAKELRHGAQKMRAAYGPASALGVVADEVAANYDEAAALLEARAVAMDRRVGHAD